MRMENLHWHQNVCPIDIVFLIKDSLTLGLNALTLTDVTKNAAYGVEIESLVLEINAPAA